MAIAPFTLTGTYQNLDGSPASGKVRVDVVSPAGGRVIDPDGNVVFAGPRTLVLDTAGHFTLTLPSDVATGESATIGYRVTAQLKHNNLEPVEFWAKASGSTWDVADIATQVVVPLTPTAVTTTDLDTRTATNINTAGTETRVAADAAIGRGADPIAAPIAQAVGLTSQPSPLLRWRTKLTDSPGTAKLVLMGDSTSDAAVEAVEILNRLKTYHTAAGRGLAGMSTANIVSYGHNGSKLSDWWATAAWKAEVTGSGADLVVLSYGLNDFRLGATTVTAFRNLLITVVDYLRDQMPNTDIVLRIPNSVTSDDPDAHGWVTMDPQQMSTDLRTAYLSLATHWPNGVAVWDAQGRVFGPKSITVTASGLMKDQLHPSAAKGYPAIADALVGDLIGAQAVAPRIPERMFDMVGRPDSATTPGSTSTGHPYTVPNGTFGVSANQLYNPTASLARAIVNVGYADGEFGVTVPVVVSGTAFLFRWKDSQNFCYVNTYGGTGGYEVWQMVNNTGTKLGAIAGGPTNGDKISVRVDRNLLRVYINGTLGGTYTLTGPAGTRIGVQAGNSTPRFTDLFARRF